MTSHPQRIVSVEPMLVRTRPATSWGDALGAVDVLSFVLVQLTADDGTTGIGLAYTVGPGGEAVHALIESCLADVYLGTPLHAVRETWHTALRVLRRAGTGGLTTMAMAALDIAAWDALARGRRLPLCAALGGTPGPVRTYGSGIDLHMGPDELGEHVVGLLAAGYTAVKVKVGSATLAEDVARLQAVRGVAPDVDLFLDANQGWTIDEAVRRMSALARFAPCWIEEPLVAEDVAGHARLRAAVPVPIAAGESLYTPQQFLDYIRLGAVDVLQPDVVRVGGVTPWMGIADTAWSAGHSVAPHYLKELSVHLLRSVPNARILEDVRGGSLADLGLATASPFDPATGASSPPDLPGHGISFDWDAIGRLRIR